MTMLSSDYPYFVVQSSTGVVLCSTVESYVVVLE